MGSIRRRELGVSASSRWLRAGSLTEEDRVAQAIDMLETHPRSLNTDAGLLASAIDALAECASTCTQCADACLAENV